MQLITITGKAKEVFAILNWIAKVAGKATLGDLVKYHKETEQ